MPPQRLFSLLAALLFVLPALSQAQIFAGGNPGRYMYMGSLWSPLPQTVYVAEVFSPNLPEPATVVVSATSNPSRSTTGYVNYQTEVYYGGSVSVTAFQPPTVSPPPSSGSLGVVISGAGALTISSGATLSLDTSAGTLSSANILGAYEFEAAIGTTENTTDYYLNGSLTSFDYTQIFNDWFGVTDGEEEPYGTLFSSSFTSFQLLPPSSAVPEPAAGSTLLAAGLGAMLLRRRRA